MSPEDHLKPKFMVGGQPLYANDAIKKYVDTAIETQLMNQPPGNPTENQPAQYTEIDAKLDQLRSEVLALNESIKNQDHIIWLAKVETLKLKTNLKATLQAIETITKPKE